MIMLNVMKRPFVYIAIVVCLFIGLLLLVGASTGALPILFLLFMNELGFLVGLFGAFSGWRLLKTDRNNGQLSLAVIFCALMAVGFMLSGFSMWPTDLAIP